MCRGPSSFCGRPRAGKPRRREVSGPAKRSMRASCALADLVEPLRLSPSLFRRRSAFDLVIQSNLNRNNQVFEPLIRKGIALSPPEPQSRLLRSPEGEACSKNPCRLFCISYAALPVYPAAGGFPRPSISLRASCPLHLNGDTLGWSDGAGLIPVSPADLVYLVSVLTKTVTQFDLGASSHSL